MIIGILFMKESLPSQIHKKMQKNNLKLKNVPDSNHINDTKDIEITNHSNNNQNKTEILVCLCVFVWIYHAYFFMFVFENVRLRVFFRFFFLFFQTKFWTIYNNGNLTLLHVISLMFFAAILHMEMAAHSNLGAWCKHHNRLGANIKLCCFMMFWYPLLLHTPFVQKIQQSTASNTIVQQQYLYQFFCSWNLFLLFVIDFREWENRKCT